MIGKALRETQLRPMHFSMKSRMGVGLGNEALLDIMAVKKATHLQRLCLFTLYDIRKGMTLPSFGQALFTSAISKT